MQSENQVPEEYLVAGMEGPGDSFELEAPCEVKWPVSRASCTVPFRLLWPCVVVVPALLLCTAAGYTCSCELEAYRLCRKIDAARTATEARLYVERLFSPQGRRCRLAVAMRLLGRGHDTLDYAIVEYVGWPWHHIPPPHVHPDWERWPDVEALVKDYLRALVPELRARPELARLYARYVWSELPGPGPRKWDPVGQAVNLLFEVSDPFQYQFLDRFEAQARVMLACWLVSRDDVIPRITAKNVRSIAKEVEDWLSRNGEYLRIDPQMPERALLDRAAKAAGRKLPPEAKEASAGALHWGPPPRWREEIGIYYDNWLLWPWKPLLPGDERARSGCGCHANTGGLIPRSALSSGGVGSVSRPGGVVVILLMSRSPSRWR